jgi:hypothetical protein
LALRQAKDKDGVPVAESIEISLEYLPDFSEEYSIHMRTGFGVNNTTIQLDQGWNLTSLNVQLDSKTSENLQAIGSLLGGVSGMIPRDGPPRGFVVQATNVPLGYYEAVIGTYSGKKHLYGFRYVGFMPYAACPLTACGMEEYDCQFQGELYGLIFENGVLTFKRLEDVRGLTKGLNQYRAAPNTQAARGTENPAAAERVETPSLLPVPGAEPLTQPANPAL